MNLGLVWTLCFFGYLILLSCDYLEAFLGPADVKKLIPSLAAKESLLTISVSNLPHSCVLQPWIERRAPYGNVGYLAPQLSLPATHVTTPWSNVRGRGVPLFSKLSFLAAPEPSTLSDEVLDARGTPLTQGSTISGLPLFVESNARYVRLSPIKTRRVVHELRGKTLAAALAHLASSPRRPALAIFRTIESAIANAVQLRGSENFRPQLVSVTATNGPVMKRPFFKARGRLNVWRRPTTHIKVIIKAM